MYHIIINPASRSGKGLKLWKEAIEPALHREKLVYRSYFSREAGDIEHITREILTAHKERPITLIILGGDGTVNEALQGMDDTSQAILGYIPTGSSNDLARDLAIPREPLAALELILHTGRAVPMAMGRLTYLDRYGEYPAGVSRKFAVSCGIGFDAAVCSEALYSKIKIILNKIGLGKLTYLGIALKQILTAKAVSCKLSLDGAPPVNIRKILFIASMLHRYEGGGFMFCPDAEAYSGRFSLCSVGDISKGLILCALPTAFWGKHYFAKGVTPYRAASLQIKTSAPLWVHTDGETPRKSAAIEITCLQNAIKIIVPQTGKDNALKS